MNSRLGVKTDMKKLFAVLFSILMVNCLAAQMLVIKPYFGYATVKMNQVNDAMINSVKSMTRITGNPLPLPEKFKGNSVWGVQLQYHLNDNYFAHFTTCYYSEKTSAGVEMLQVTSPYLFSFKREIRYLSFNFGINYYFHYSSWRRLNPYFNAAAGITLGWTDSNFKYLNPQNSASGNNLDNHADLTASTLTANAGLGLSVKITQRFSLNLEGGYQFANLGQMKGKYTTLTGTDSNFTTDEDYNFSGIYIIGGVGFVLPFI